MTVVLLLCAALLVSFAGVLLVGAPYLPTLTPQIDAALNLCKLQKGDTLLELGCGDGRVVAVAAARGLRVVGYELNPFLACVAWLRTRKYRQNVTIIWGDFWRQQWPPAEAIFVFLLPKYMKKLDTNIARYPAKPVRLVSFAFSIPNKKPQQEKQGVYLYVYD